MNMSSNSPNKDSQRKFNNMGTCWTYLYIIFLHQVTVAHINATAKNAADDKLRQSLRRFAETHTAPATVILVSCEFSFDTLSTTAFIPHIILW